MQSIFHENLRVRFLHGHTLKCVAFTEKAWKRNLTTKVIFFREFGKIETEQIKMCCLHALYVLIKYLAWNEKVYVREGRVTLTWAETQHAIFYYTVLLVRGIHFDCTSFQYCLDTFQKTWELKASTCCGAKMNLSTLVSLLWISVKLRQTHAEGEFDVVLIMYFESLVILFFFFVHPNSMS